MAINDIIAELTDITDKAPKTLKPKLNKVITDLQRFQPPQIGNARELLPGVTVRWNGWGWVSIGVNDEVK